MDLLRYYFKRTLEDTHSGYGMAAESIEPCPIYPDIMIGSGACINKDCCVAHSKYMTIVTQDYNCVVCQATTELMMKDTSKGQWRDRIVGDNELLGMKYKPSSSLDQIRIRNRRLLEDNNII